MSDTLPLVSIIIPHQAGTEILTDCLAALRKRPNDLRVEIIVVDNGSSDQSVRIASERFPEIQVLRLEENQGFAGGCNRGMEIARGDYMLLLNDDAEVEPDCIAELLRTAQADPAIAACQPKVRAMSQRSHFEYSGAAGGLMDVYGYPFARGRLMDHVEADEGQYDEPAEVFWASGVCLLLRRSVLDEIGAFDETFFAYMEEIDLCWRIHLQGHRVVYVPSATVYHVGGYSLERRDVKRMYLNHRNSVIMLFKNYETRSLLRILPVKLALEVFILTGALLRNPRRSRAVLLSFGWLLTHIGTLRRLRARVQKERRVPDAEIVPRLYASMAPIWFFLFGIHHAIDLPDVDPVLHQPYRGPGADRPRDAVQPRPRNFLYAYLDQAPISLALMRAVECRHLAKLRFERPILDVGCGDGTFARILFNGVTVDAGIDQNEEEVARARTTRCYDDLHVSRIEDLPFESGSFATAYSNCVLEHVADIEGALREIHRVLRPGGALYMTVPNPRCVTYLVWRDLLRRLGLTGLGDWYGNLTLRLFKAENILEPEGWEPLLAQAGFALEHHEPYMPLEATRIQDVLLLPAFVSVIAKGLLGRKLLLPRLHRIKVRLYRHWLDRAYAEVADEGSATLIVARKPAEATIAASAAAAQ